MVRYWWGSATFLFRPTPNSGFDSKKKFTGDCPTWQRAPTEARALEICRQAAEHAAGYDYDYESEVSRNLNSA